MNVDVAHDRAFGYSDLTCGFSVRFVGLHHDGGLRLTLGQQMAAARSLRPNPMITVWAWMFRCHRATLRRARPVRVRASIGGADQDEHEDHARRGDYQCVDRVGLIAHRCDVAVPVVEALTVA